MNISSREINYEFFNLGYVEQTKILIEHDLLENCDGGKKYSSSFFSEMLERAEKTNKLIALITSIHMKYVEMKG